jgi:predicted tellurium resistance membrane protein TerC
MELLTDPQVWLSFLTLAVLEIVLGIDNIIFLAIIVDRLPSARRRGARLLGLGFAMVTRIALLYSITWLASLRTTLFTVLGNEISGRDLILFGGGLFLIVKSPMEIREMLSGKVESRKATAAVNSIWLVILQIGLIDIVFSLDSVFRAIGLSKHIEVMVAAIVASVVVMMVVSPMVGRIIERFPTLKVLALASLVLVGLTLIAESLGMEIPHNYLYVAMAFSAAVEWINIRLRRRAET